MNPCDNKVAGSVGLLISRNLGQEREMTAIFADVTATKTYGGR
jgi:hypothetical protein